jgi:tetratricopeptide (TPR) repeat protein
MYRALSRAVPSTEPARAWSFLWFNSKLDLLDLLPTIAAWGGKVRFCPQCGAPIMAAARFCVECGISLDTAKAAPGDLPPASATVAGQGGRASTQPRLEVFAPFAATFCAIVGVGILVAYAVMKQLPQRNALVASAIQPNSQVSPTSMVKDSQQLPPGHPDIRLPKEARDFIAGMAQKAEANPQDVALWDKYGDVCFRAAAFESSYYPKSASAYAHVLQLAPDDLDALRGIGNIDFDQHKYDEAIAAYEHYLSRKPDDPEVRTDLGTMLLSSGSADQAVLQYRKVLETNPSFFEASFNLGIAYGQMHELEAARAAFEKAKTLAPDTSAKNRVSQMLAEVGGDSGAAQVASNSAPAISGGPAKSSFEGAMEQMLRDLPIAGPKVASIQWPSATKARVLMQNFPMDQMPPFAASKFMSDLKAGIGGVKSTHSVSAQVEIDICDAASGRVMQAVTE